MRKLTALAVAFALLAAPALAKDYAVPEKNPAATISIPDSWETDEIEFGYGAFSPGKDVYFSIETADAGSVERMKKANLDWMASNNIKLNGEPKTTEKSFNGIKGSVLSFDAKDDNGPTNVQFAILPISNKRLIFLTMWASDEEYKKHEAAFDRIIASLKPIE